MYWSTWQVALLGYAGLQLASTVPQVQGRRLDQHGGGKRHPLRRVRSNEGKFEAVCPMAEAAYTTFPNGSTGFVHKCPGVWYRNSTIKMENTDYHQYDNSLAAGGDITLYNITGSSEGLGTSNGTAYVENLLLDGEWGYTNTILDNLEEDTKQSTPLAWGYRYIANNISKLHKPHVDAQCFDGTPDSDYPAKECAFLKKTKLECPGPHYQRTWCGMVKMNNLRVRMLYRFDLGRVYETVYGDSKDSPSLCRYWDFVYADSMKAPMPGREDMNLFLSMGDAWYKYASNNVGNITADHFSCAPGTGFEDHSCMHRMNTNYILNKYTTIPYYVNAGGTTLSLPSTLGIYDGMCSSESGMGLAGLNCPKVSMNVNFMSLDGSDFYQVSKAAKFERSYKYWSYEKTPGSLTPKDLEPPPQCFHAGSI